VRATQTTILPEAAERIASGIELIERALSVRDEHDTTPNAP